MPVQPVSLGSELTGNSGPLEDKSSGHFHEANIPIPLINKLCKREALRLPSLALQ